MVFQRVCGHGATVGVFLLALRLGLMVGVVSGATTPIRRSNQMSFGDLLTLIEESDRSNNWAASVDFLRHEGSPRDTCRSRGLCKCFSKITRRSFCCDCLGGGPCFPGDAKVLTPSGEVPMDQLATGDLVLTGDSTGVSWSPVVAWLDRRPKVEAQYLSLSTSAGPRLTLSSSHVLLEARGPGLTSKFAGQVEVGDAVVTLNADAMTFPAKENCDVTAFEDEEGSSKVKRVLRANVTEVIPVIKKGAYVPMTLTGTIFVNGVLASCYASVTHDLAHAALAPVRWAPEWAVGGQREGTMPLVTALKWVARWFVPNHLCAPTDTTVTLVRMPGEEALKSSGILGTVSSAIQLAIASV